MRAATRATAALACAILAAACGNEQAPAPPPPAPSAEAPAPLETFEPDPEPPPPPPPACPEGMLLVDGRVCVDKWEASLVDRATGEALSPYYPPDRKLALRLRKQWEEERHTVGSDKARMTPVPPLGPWQREHDAEPVAVSRPGVVPSGYLSGHVARRACENAGKRLCRYDEWTAACEGQARRPFPYGERYVQGACNIFRAMHPAAELHGDPSTGHLDPRLNLVMERAGEPLLRKTGATTTCASQWGDDAAWDMNGNLDEWVEDPKGRFAGGFYARSKRDGCRSAVAAHGHAYQDYSTGVRCCADPDRR